MLLKQQLLQVEEDLWSAASTWVGGVVPLSSDDGRIIDTVTIDVNVTVQSVNVIGTLIQKSGIVFTVGNTSASGSFTVTTSTIFGRAVITQQSKCFYYTM